jgi:hypothetical protein
VFLDPRLTYHPEHRGTGLRLEALDALGLFTGAAEELEERADNLLARVARELRRSGCHSDRLPHSK